MLPDGSHMNACIARNIVVSSSLTLYNVLYIPTFHVNLISVPKLISSNDCHLSFSSNMCHILQNHSKKTIGITSLQRSIYVIDTHVVISHFNYVVSNSFEIWHLRLGHASNSSMQTLAKNFPLIYYINNMNPCDSCHYVKQKRLSFPNSITNTHSPFELLHADLWGPFTTESILGQKYFLTLVDDYSRFAWIIFFTTKSEIKQSIIHFVASLENQFNNTLKCFRSDNGSEFLSLNDFFLSKGINHQKSCVETPQ